MPIKTHENIKDAVIDVLRRIDKCQELTDTLESFEVTRYANERIRYGFYSVLQEILVQDLRECYPKKYSTNFGTLFTKLLSAYLSKQKLVCKKDADSVVSIYQEISELYSKLKTVAETQTKLFESFVSVDKMAIVNYNIMENTKIFLEHISRRDVSYGTISEADYEFDNYVFNNDFLITPIMNKIEQEYCNNRRYDAKFSLKITPFKKRKGMWEYDRNRVENSEKLVEYINEHCEPWQISFTICNFDDENELQKEAEKVQKRLWELIREACKALGI